jgi:hypothetical protein
MTKIHINLNPKVEKFNKLIFRELSYYAALGAGIILAIILLLGLFAASGLAKYKGYQAKWKSWEDKAVLLGKLKGDILEQENKKKEFKNIILPQNQAAKIFEDLYAALPQNIWLEALDLKKEGLNIKGYVVRLDEDYLFSLEKFIKSLAKRPHFPSKFKKINIKDSQKQNFNGVEVLEFNIECVS